MKQLFDFFKISSHLVFLNFVLGEMVLVNGVRNKLNCQPPFKNKFTYYV